MNPHDEAAQLVRDWLRTASPATQLSAADEETLRSRIADFFIRQEHTMQITEVTVSYGLTEPLRQYENVRPEIRLTAKLDAGDDYRDAIDALTAQARGYVQSIADTALEDAGLPARYDTISPRFKIIQTYDADQWRIKKGYPTLPAAIAIVPDAVNINEVLGPDRWYTPYINDRSAQGIRLMPAIRLAEAACKRWSGALIYDCSDGDLAPLSAVLPIEAPPQEPPTTPNDAPLQRDDEDDDEDDDDEEEIL